ncbi:MAG: DUF3883 domain-containing protein [Fuerstiella sp.]|nr:DUF3883 domain-containing protein [Fuerstiella sp.]
MIEIDRSAFRRTHRAFLKRMKEKGDGVPFTSFGHRFIVADELAYKHEALRQGRKILSFDKWPKWRRQPGKILAAMRDACKSSVSGNLLEHKYGEKKGSYSALYLLETQTDIREFESHIADLQLRINESDDVIAEAFDAFAGFLKSKHLGCKWEFVAYFLFLMRPERFFPIRSTHFQRVLNFYGIECKIATQVRWERYKLILDVAELVTEELRLYGSPSALEVQSYMWVVSYLLKNLEEDNDDTIIDFEEELRRRQRREEEKQRIGVLGEKYVFEFERDRLVAAGKQELAAKVRLISAITDDAGYDILSFTTKGVKRHIEVKSTARSQQAGECFWISENEVQTALSDSSWTLFRVWRADNVPHHHDLGNIVLTEPDNWERTTSSWIVRRTP